MSRFGLMHMIATNICNWLKVLIIETSHEIKEIYDANHTWVPIRNGPNNGIIDLENHNDTADINGKSLILRKICHNFWRIHITLIALTPNNGIPLTT